MRKPKWTPHERMVRGWILRRYTIPREPGGSPSDKAILKFICDQTGWAPPTKRTKRAFMLRFWQHDNGDSSLPLPKKRDRSRVARRARMGFYDSQSWHRLRYQALALHGAKCQCCGATRQDGVKLHVDHIKPRSKYPELELELTNLQILCEACNLGKSNTDETDWRLRPQPVTTEQ